MSAREELRKALMQGVAQSSEYSDFLIDRLLEEEAERLREKAKDLARYRSYEMSQQAQGLRYGADLIDPYTT